MIGSKPIMLLLRYSICPLACLEICTLSPSTHLLSTYPSCFHNLLPNHLVKKVLLKDTSSSCIVVLFKNEQLTTFLTSSSIMSLILRLYLVSCSIRKELTLFQIININIIKCLELMTTLLDAS